MREEFEKLVAAGKIDKQQVEPLLALAANRYCRHRSWGFGQITQFDPVFAQFVIDFPGKPGHKMDLRFAARSLELIPSDHILARKALNLNDLRQMAAVHHLELVKVVLQSYNGHATVEQIRQMLVPDVITDDWKKWWEAARREMRKDGHFVVPLKKTEAILYQTAEVSLQDRLMEEFRGAKGLKARLVVAAELLRNLADLNDPQTAVLDAVALLNTEIASHQRTLPALAIEAVFMRDDLRAAANLPAAEAELATSAVWAQVDNLGKVLEQIQAGKHKRALDSLKQARPTRWQDSIVGILNSVGARLCSECAVLLIEGGALEQLKHTVSRLISQHLASSELLLWLAKERSDSFADILGPEVFRAMLSAIERDQFLERKSNRLCDYIMGDQELLVELIESADIEVIKDLTRALQLSPSFDDMDKRSLLARIVKHFPVVQSLISSDHARQDNSLVVSWESLERRKEEYNELVHKRIPANSKDIAVARSYGDLRENHEYKAAKETHRLLMRRKSELESQLIRARGTDFSDPRTDVASIGTLVHVTESGAEHTETFGILGAWDFDVERHIISYLSPIAQALLGRKLGDEVQFELAGVTRKYRIDGIVPFLAAAVPGAPAMAATPPQASAPSAPPPAPAPAPTPVTVEPPVAAAAPASVEPPVAAAPSVPATPSTETPAPEPTGAAPETPA